jgi:hypothetical protein
VHPDPGVERVIAPLDFCIFANFCCIWVHVLRRPARRARRAEEQTRIAESRRLAAEASSALTNYPQRSLSLVVEAVKLGQSLHSGARVAAEQLLREALASVGG